MRIKAQLNRLRTVGRPAARLSPKRRQLLDALPKHSTGAEVGVWKGELSAAIVSVVHPARLYLVDPWRFTPDYPASLYGGNSATSQADMDAIHASVVRRFHGRPEVEVLRMASVDAVGTLEALDWVYIDGDHTYDGVRADLAAYGAKVKAGGIVCGDDYWDGGWWGDGVIRAVDEFVAAHGLELELLGGQRLIRLPDSGIA